MDAQQNPNIPNRNPNRKSREYADGTRPQYADGPPQLPRMDMDSGSPARYNFSHPSRSNLRDDPVSPPPPNGQQPRPQGTFESLRQVASGGYHPQEGGTFSNLKAAAVGLHGVGETLRLSLIHI